MARAPVEIDTGEAGQATDKELTALYHMLRYGRSFSGKEKNCCFLNTGGTRFANISACSGLDYPDDSRSLATTDWDFDGDLDLWMSNRTAPRLRFLRNDSPRTNHFVAFRLQGNGTTTNRDGIGARVEVVLADQKDLRQVKTLYAGSGFQSQSSKWMHFGLGKSDQITDVIVKWPAGEEEHFKVEADRFYRLVQGSGEAQVWTPPIENVEFAAKPTTIPEPGRAVRTVFSHPMEMLNLDYKDFSGLDETAFVRDSGKPTLVMLWAIGCGCCETELPHFAERADDIKAAGLNVVALNVNGVPGTDLEATPQEAEAELAKHGFPFRGGMANEEILHRIQIIQDDMYSWHKPLVTPTSFLITADGRTAVIYKGEIDIDRLLQDVSELGISGQDRVRLAQRIPGRWIAKYEAGNPQQLAEIYHKKGFLPEAKSLYGKALMLDDIEPKQAAFAHYNLGLIAQLDSKNKDEVDLVAMGEAMEHYEKSVELHPTPIAHNNLGKAYEAFSRFDEAIENYEAAIKMDANFAQFYVNYARLLIERGNLTEAVRKLRTAIEKEPTFVESYALLSSLMEGFGQPEEAVKILQQGLKANPGDERLIRRLPAGTQPEGRASSPEASGAAASSPDKSESK